MSFGPPGHRIPGSTRWVPVRLLHRLVLQGVQFVAIQFLVSDFGLAGDFERLEEDEDDDDDDDDCYDDGDDDDDYYFCDNDDYDGDIDY